MKIAVRDAGRARILDLSGDLKLGNDSDGALRETIKEMIASGQTRFVINLKHVPWIDSMGIGALAVCKKRAKEKGGDVKLLNPVDKVDRILRSLMLTDWIQIYNDEGMAVGSF